MEILSLPLLALMSHLFVLLLLSSAAESEGKNINIEDDCQPQSFNCGSFGQFSFPYTPAESPFCGLCILDCSGSSPRLRLGWREQSFYEIEEFLSNDTIKVRDNQMILQKFDTSCDIFSYNITLPSKPSVAFEFFPNITLLKCYNLEGQKFQPPAQDMLGNHSCENFTVYYPHPSQKKGVLVSNLTNLPANCEFITLPAAETASRLSNSSGDFFSLLSYKFKIHFQVTSQCQDCLSKGHQCSINSPEFSCKGEETQGFKTPEEAADIIMPRKGQNVAPVLGVSAVGIAFAVLLFYCLWRYWSGKPIIKFWAKENEAHRNVEAILKDSMHLTPNRYSYADVKKMTSSFREKLGQGGYGDVYKGELRNGTPLAVKVLKETRGDGEEFMNEVTSISRTSHVNVVPLLGYCFEGHKRVLIYEYMTNGSLEKFLHNWNSVGEHHLGFEKLHSISVGVAQGLEYLHRGCNARILHLDIKPQNILLDEDFCPRISDFGLAKLCHNKESIVSMLGARGTIGYIAPEVFCRRYGGVSHKSDVYSYGMTILDMVGVNKDIASEVDGTSEVYFPDMIYRRLEVVDPEIGQHGNMNAEDNERARKMMIVGLWCIQTEPSSRPAMSKVVDMLKGTLESLPIPPRPILSSLPRELANSSKMDNLSSSSVCLAQSLAE